MGTGVQVGDYIAAEGPAWIWIATVLGLILFGVAMGVLAWNALKWATARRGSTLVERDLVLRMAAAEERAEVLESRLARINGNLDPDKRYTAESPSPT